MEFPRNVHLPHLLVRLLSLLLTHIQPSLPRNRPIRISLFLEKWNTEDTVDTYVGALMLCNADVSAAGDDDVR